jgi:hypothetical protein
VPVGHLPTIGEAIERLETLRRVGPSPPAFTFRALFQPPDELNATSPNVGEEASRASP